jgi:hypothetical protein
MVLVSKSKQELQEAFSDLHVWSQENDFTINKKKTAWYLGKEETLQKLTTFAAMVRG